MSGPIRLIINWSTGRRDQSNCSAVIPPTALLTDFTKAVGALFAIQTTTSTTATSCGQNMYFIYLEDNLDFSLTGEA